MSLVNLLIYFCAVILPWFLSGGLIIYFFITNKKIAGLRLVGLSFLGAVSAWLLVSLFKYNFPSPRPFEIYENLKPLFTTGRGDAFPSGHATFMGALALGVFLQNKKWGLLFVFGAIVISLARVLANVHSLLDVIAGLLFGALVATIVSGIYHRIYPK